MWHQSGCPMTEEWRANCQAMFPTMKNEVTSFEGKWMQVEI